MPGLLFLGSISSTFYTKLLQEKMPKAHKDWQLDCIFALLRSVRVKAERKMLVKSIPYLSLAPNSLRDISSFVSFTIIPPPLSLSHLNPHPLSLFLSFPFVRGPPPSVWERIYIKERERLCENKCVCERESEIENKLGP